MRGFRGAPIAAGGQLLKKVGHSRRLDRLADELPRLWVATAARANDPVEADETDDAAWAETDGIVEFFQLEDIERGPDDAGKRAIAVRQPPRQLNRSLAGHEPGHRLADIEVVTG